MTDKGLLVMLLVFVISILGVYFVLNVGASNAEQEQAVIYSEENR